MPDISPRSKGSVDEAGVLCWCERCLHFAFETADAMGRTGGLACSIQSDSQVKHSKRLRSTDSSPHVSLQLRYLSTGWQLRWPRGMPV